MQLSAYLHTGLKPPRSHGPPWECIPDSLYGYLSFPALEGYHEKMRNEAWKPENQDLPTDHIDKSTDKPSRKRKRTLSGGELERAKKWRRGDGGRLVRI